MLFRSPLLGQTSQFDLLTLGQFADQRAFALGIGNDGVTNGIVDSLSLHHQIPRIYRHDATVTAHMQSQGHTASYTVILAVAITGILEVLLAVLRIQWNQTQPMGQHLIGNHGGVVFNFDQIECDGRDLGENDTAKGVGKCEINGA